MKLLVRKGRCRVPVWGRIVWDVKFEKDLTDGVGRAFQAEGTAWAKCRSWEMLPVKSSRNTSGIFEAT